MISYSKAVLGLVAFLSVVMVTLLTIDTLDSSLEAVVVAVSIAIPALIMHLGIWDEVDTEQLRTKVGAKSVVFGISGLIGYAAAYVAVACVFLHFSVLAAITFSLGALSWLLLTVKVQR